jgi:hypothetical protein
MFQQLTALPVTFTPRPRREKATSATPAGTSTELAATPAPKAPTAPAATAAPTAPTDAEPEAAPALVEAGGRRSWWRRVLQLH